MLAFGKKKSFGIDIGTQTIKITEVVGNGNNFLVDNYCIWNDDINKVIQQKDGGSDIPPEEMSKIVNFMLQNADMDLVEAYVALPSYLALFSVIPIPLLDEKEFLTAVPLEAKKHIPVPLNTVQLDWINLGKNKFQDQYDVLIMAIPDTVVSKYVDLSKSLGIKIKGFELDCFSTLRALSLPKENTCVIDMGARTSTVLIVNSDNKLQTIQSFDFGGNQITESIAKMKGISVEEAELLKKQNAMNGADVQVSEFIKSKINSFIATDVMRLLKAVSDRSGININNFVILGGMSKMTGIDEYISSILKIQLNSTAVKVFQGSFMPNISIKGVKDKKIALDILQDLVLSVGVSLKNYIE